MANTIFDYQADPQQPGSASIFACLSSFDINEETKKAYTWSYLINEETNTPFNRIFIFWQLFCDQNAWALKTYVCEQMQDTNVGYLIKYFKARIDVQLISLYESKLMYEKTWNAIDTIGKEIQELVNSDEDINGDKSNNIARKLSQAMVAFNPPIKMVIFGWENILLEEKEINSEKIPDLKLKQVIKPIFDKLRAFKIKIMILSNGVDVERMKRYFTQNEIGNQVNLWNCCKSEGKLNIIR